MNTSDHGRKLILEREGCVLTPYRDSVGVWTDGVGNTVDVVPNGPPITSEKADADLKRNLGMAETAVGNVVTVVLEPHQFDALVSFVFNVGRGAFLSSTLLRRINAGDMDAAAREFDRWHIPPEITARRTAEREQFRSTASVARIERAA